MNKKELQKYLDRIGQSVEEGYNYAIYSIPVHGAKYNLLTALQNMKEYIETQYARATGKELKLLPYVAYMRQRSIVIPLPFATSINVITEILQEYFRYIMPDLKFPAWI